MKGFILASVLSIANVLACSPGAVRKEWRQLSGGQQQAFLNAVKQLNQRQDDTGNDSSDPSTWSFAHFAVVHARYQQANHNQGGQQAPPFFAWHRIFLHYYEKALQSIDPSVTLPYWDWSQDSQNPLGSDVLAQSAFGTSIDGSGCVTGGQFAGWSSAVNGGCLKRCSQSGALYGSTSTVQLMNASPNYASLNRQIQDGPHAIVHNVIGGRCADGGVGDFYTMSSAGDPIFYMHHAMVDKIWMMWQNSCPSKFANDYSGSINSALPPFSETAQDVLKFSSRTGNFCYDYSSSGINGPQLTSGASCPAGGNGNTGGNGNNNGNNANGNNNGGAASSAGSSPTKTGASSASATAVAPDGSVDQYFAELRLLDLIPGSSQLLQAAFPGFSNDKINTIPHFSHASGSTAASKALRKGKRDYVVPTTTVAATTTAPASTTTDLAVVHNSTTTTVAVTTTANTTTTEYVSPTYLPPLPEVIPTYRLNPNYTVVAPPSNDTTNLYKLRHPASLDQDFMKLMHIDEKSARYLEYIVKKHIDDLNNTPGYVAPSALIHFNKYNKLGGFTPSKKKCTSSYSH
ncbi:hypothetical protein HK103_007542 [Boothiomyces macroporosus]|uniref:Tyrosinase copper-binding domain-containing protein n=1 Tax=Boothiomyces macroporosus TaxID=261099 RepID=A0AAD5Y3X9_9FUNG|nr:hypothetical protein HK103_007542 [Boothiomyces macroporosus]